MEQNQLAQQHHDRLMAELLKELRPPISSPTPVEVVKRSLSKDSGKERLQEVTIQVLNRLEKQQAATEDLNAQVRALLEGAAERHVADRLEVLYARHEARIEHLLLHNEKAMEDWLGQVRMAQRTTGKEQRDHREARTAELIMLPTEVSHNRTVGSDGQEGHRKEVGHFRGRRHDVPLDIAALSAVQGWKTLVVERTRKSHREGGSRMGWPRLQRLSETTLESASAFLVMANLIFMGIDAQVSLTASRAGEPAPPWLWGTGIFFLAMLVLEVVLRMSLERWDFVFGENWTWNIFDVVLVTFQILDTILVLYNLNFLRALRVLRALRTTRAVKTMRSVRELRVMIASIGNSVVSLLWAFVLLFMALYAVSLVLMQSLVAYIENTGPSRVNTKLFDYYGSMELAMISLFKAVSGGALWADLLAPLEEISALYVVGFLFFITFTVFGMLNVLTAIFVDSTSKMSAFDHELVIQEHLDAKNSTAAQLRKLLLEADEDQSGTISRKEFESRLSDPRFAAQLSVLELDIYEAQGLFNILRYEDTQGVPIEEFIYGLMRMKGNAKGVDMVTMLSENRRILAKLLAFMEFMDDSMLDLRAALHIPGDTCLQDYLDAN